MIKRKILGLIAAILATAIIFTGCGSTNVDASKDAKIESEVRVVSTLKGDVNIPINPTRIADISGSSEELLILGYTPIATANTDPYNTNEFPSYIKEKMGSASIVGFNMMDTMDVEGILESDPDLIIMSKRQEKIYDLLKDIAPVVMIEDYDNDWRGKMMDVAKLFGQESDAEKWLQDYDKKAQEISKDIIGKNGNQTYLTVLASGGQFFIFSDAGIGAILKNDMNLAQPSNMPPQDGISLPVVTMEGLSEIDSDHIVVIATDADKKELENSSVWKNIRAVKDGNVTMLESTPFFGQGYNPIGRELLLNVIKEKFTGK